MTTRNLNKRRITGKHATLSRNGLSGWPAFRAIRQEPAPIIWRRHANWKHGRYAKGRGADLRFLRLIARALAGRGGDPVDWAPPRVRPSGWRVYWASR